MSLLEAYVLSCMT